MSVTFLAPRSLALSVTVLLASFAGCVQPPPVGDVDAATAAGSMSTAPAVGRADWTGHVITSETDVLMHSAPTEGILWPYEQAGVIVEIPEGVTAVEVAVAWTGEGSFGIHLHSHNGDGEYVGHRSTSEQWSENPHCIRIPAEDVAPGHWMVMVHSDSAVEDDFTMSVLTESVVPVVLQDDRHGHDRAKEIVEGRDMKDHETEACTMWTPGEAPHEH